MRPCGFAGFGAADAPARVAVAGPTLPPGRRPSRAEPRPPCVLAIRRSSRSARQAGTASSSVRWRSARRSPWGRTARCARPAPRPGTRGADGEPAQREPDRLPGGGLVDVDPADQRDDRRQRVEPHLVRPAQLGLPAAQHDQGRDLRQPWMRPVRRQRQLITSVSVNSEPIAVITPIASRPSVGKCMLRVQLGEHRQEHLVPRGFVGHPRAAEQAGEHRAERRDHDRRP